MNYQAAVENPRIINSMSAFKNPSKIMMITDCGRLKCARRACAHHITLDLLQTRQISGFM